MDDSDLILIRGSDLIRLRDIMRTGFLQNPDNIKSFYYQSLLIEVLVELRFLLQAWENEGATPHVNFNDDIPTTKHYNEIVGLIAFFRNTACHSASNNKLRSSDNGVMYVLQDCRKPLVFMTQGINLTQYGDEIAVVAGDHVLLVNKHVVRAYEEIYSAMLADERFNAYKPLIQLRVDAGN